MTDKKTGIKIRTISLSGEESVWHADNYEDAAVNCPTTDGISYNPIEYFNKYSWLADMVESGLFDEDEDTVSEYLDMKVMEKPFKDISGPVVYYTEPAGDEYLVELQEFDRDWLCNMFISHGKHTCEIFKPESLACEITIN